MTTSETALAFDSLDARSGASLGREGWDRIALRDHIVDVEIGAFQSERGTTQRVAFDIVVEVFPAKAQVDDDVDLILSYDTLVEAVSSQFAVERLNLLETLAERIAGTILQEPQAARVFVRIQKLDRGPGALGVEIVRAKSADRPASADGAVSLARPILVVFSEAALGAQNLPLWVAQLQASETPIVIMVLPDLAATPAIGPADVQRRIDLLSIEQAAWRLAGMHESCVVMATRTELDHAAKTGMVVALAPAKIVLDSTTNAAPDPRDAAGFVGCVAQELGALAVVCVGLVITGSARCLDTRTTTLPLDGQG